MPEEDELVEELLPKPLTVGTHVLFFKAGQREPLTAIVAKIHEHTGPIIEGVKYNALSGPAGMTMSGIVKAPEGTFVNLMVISEDGVPFNKIKVPFMNDGEPVPELSYCKAEVQP